MNIIGLEEVDKKILEMLADNARLTYSEIGEQVGISRVSVKNHVEMMEERGIIKGYKTIINEENKESGKRFFIDIICYPEKYNEVLDYMACLDYITKIYATTGECRLHLEGYVPSQDRYEVFTQTLRRHLDGIKSIYMADVICTYLNKEKAIDYERREKEV